MLFTLSGVALVRCAQTYLGGEEVISGLKASASPITIGGEILSPPKNQAMLFCYMISLMTSFIINYHGTGWLVLLLKNGKKRNSTYDQGCDCQ